jgi:hypothetical protein
MRLMENTRMQTSAFASAPCRKRRPAGRILAAIVATVLIGPVFAQKGEPEAVPYPEGFRSWAHVKTALVSASHPDFDRSGGFRHIYANPAAIAGYRSGTFADGSIIVVDWLEGHDDKGAFTEGARQRVDVMVKDRARFAATGGWGFERFKGDSRTERAVTSPPEQCFACHAKARDRDSVFSRLRD